MLRAGDDLLAGEATLAETDAVDQIEIQHLCHEQFLRRGINLRQPGADVGAPPGPFDLRGVVRRAGQSCVRQLRKIADDPITVRIAGDAADPDSVSFGVAVGCLRDRKPGAVNALGTVLTRNNERFARVLDRHLGAQHELAQALRDGRHEFVRQNGDQAGGVRQEVQHRQHAALVRGVGRQQRLARREPARVIGDLALQKADAVGSGEA
jgi:hypothetical protein